MDYSALRARVVSVCIPNTVLGKEEYLVGVVYHTVDNISDIRDSGSLVWLKGFKVRKIKTIYRKQQLPSGGTMPKKISICLSMNGQDLRDESKMEELDQHHDKLIILQASQTPQYTQNDSVSTLIKSTNVSYPRVSPDPAKNHSETPHSARNLVLEHDDVDDSSDDNDDDVPSELMIEGQKIDSKRENNDHGVLEGDSREYFSAADLASQDSGAYTQMEFDSTYMAAINNIKDVERLEASVRQGLRHLSDVEGLLQREAGKSDVDSWLSHIKLLEKQALYKRTVIGVVGNTGAGKSSLINCLLGKPRFLPTSSMRACTAVVTCILWNRSEDPSKEYYASVEFISQEEWSKELATLFDAIAEGKGSSGSKEPLVAQAYSKVKALYPTISLEDLKHSSRNALLQQDYVRKHLGTTKKIFSHCPDKFCDALQRYINTSENDKSSEKKTRGPKQPEWWPLIKRVKIFLKAEVLRTGAWLVDLPGVQDSNAARAAVADGYMKMCSSLFIVASITRAVDEESAKTLLGKSFKQQMNCDGLVSRVTFICSRTDDINDREVMNELNLHDEVKSVEDQAKAVATKLKEAEKNLEETRKEIKRKLDQFKLTSREQKTWARLHSDCLKGKLVFTPDSQGPTKRKQSSADSTVTRKRTRKQNDESCSTQTEAKVNLFVIIDDSDEEPEDTAPLTEVEIKSKREQLDTQFGELQRTGIYLQQAETVTSHNISVLQEEQKALLHKKKYVCISARNDWSRARIQEDYAQGIRELDQECAQEENEETFDPDVEIRDYEEVARGLPVFCVSSKAFQGLNGWGIDCPAGFNKVEDTEIPQLVAHCIKLTEDIRIASGKQFIADMTRMLISVGLWSANDGLGIEVTDEERKAELSLLTQRLGTLQRAMDTAIEKDLNRLKVTQTTLIGQPLTRAVRSAGKHAVPTAKQWGLPKDDGGMAANTYKAVIRRSGGPFKSGKISWDFNIDLSSQFLSIIATGWEKYFQQSLPMALNSYGTSIYKTIQKFHELVDERARTCSIGLARVSYLSQNLGLWEGKLQQMVKELCENIAEHQKEATRHLTPIAKASMQETYQYGAGEKGAGSVKRIKNHLEAHVSHNANLMYKKCSKSMRSQVNSIPDMLRVEMEHYRDVFLDEIRRDYVNAIIGVALDSNLTKDGRIVRTEINKKVHEINQLFNDLTTTKTIDLTEEDKELAEPELEPESQNIIQEEQDAEDVVKEVWIEEEEENGSVERDASRDCVNIGGTAVEDSAQQGFGVGTPASDTSPPCESQGSGNKEAITNLRDERTAGGDNAVRLLDKLPLLQTSGAAAVIVADNDNSEAGEQTLGEPKEIQGHGDEDEN